MAFTYKDVVSGKKRGTTYWLPAYVGRPDFRGVGTKQDFDDNVDQIGTHLLRILKSVRRNGPRPVKEVVVGKTYLKHNKRYEKSDPVNGETWAYEGVRSRWNTKYNPEGFDGLVVATCFVKEDVPPVLAAHGATQQTLCLLYEEGVTEWMIAKLKADTEHETRVANADSGGGGRQGKTVYAGYAIYLAFKFEPAQPSEL